MIVKVTVCHDLYVEADSEGEARSAVNKDYNRVGKRYYSIRSEALDESQWKPDFKVDPKTKELISL